MGLRLNRILLLIVSCMISSSVFQSHAMVYENENKDTHSTKKILTPIYVEQGASTAIFTNLRQPLFAVKTNLLFDALTAINLELEVPIGQRWSVAGELICPWWLNKDKQNCLQLLNGNLEGRYWLGNRSKNSVMTGWFAGLYAGGGYYDLARNAKGYQGEFFIAAGLSGGYSHAINRSGSLRMEYSLGIGFMKTKYRQYKAEWDNAEKWHLYRETTGNYTWFGPTRLKVSLVWMLHSKKKGGVK